MKLILKFSIERSLSSCQQHALHINVLLFVISNQENCSLHLFNTFSDGRAILFYIQLEINNSYRNNTVYFELTEEFFSINIFNIAQANTK